jgi:cyclophilin family peptidyl-prolyl cis-trans isomerase
MLRPSLTTSPHRCPSPRAAIAALALLAMVAAAVLAGGQPAYSQGEGTEAAELDGVLVDIDTSVGRIRIALLAEEAPVTVANFLALVDKGFYDGTVFHRVLPNLIQCGGYGTDLERRPRGEEIVNEAPATSSNLRGTVAMVHRPGRPHSATSEFFINVADNTYLDHRNDSPKGFGWAVFAQVHEGMEVVDTIASVPTGQVGPFVQHFPLTQVVVESIRRVEQ